MPGNVDNGLIYHPWVLIPFWLLQIVTEILVIIFHGSGLTYLIMAFSVTFCYADPNGGINCNTGRYDTTDSVAYAFVLS